MQLNEMEFQSATPIDGYGPGFFRVGGQVLEGPIVVTETGAKSWGGLMDEAMLVELTDVVDVIFIGTGAQIAPLPEGLRETLEGHGLGVEIMASGAACRTYNVLLSEGRRVAAALIPV
ncbi:Mth938-like domain-containing protein [Roseovarius sp. SCSIO 43702]|uniref:Mth938-like domain-containing protein n=1 Tax=Roseovarius sp. SCSIO 43702 TaxID=2823043 RepID=UPI001C73B082|nr:Mth938-like domain-containing protein [Roseovarius sp. SCSIO 43702]QYX57901.1 Mth938-like domain-containing protein [Roseovarius sp. SCSIO 43702]